MAGKDLVLSMGSPPKLGAKQGSPRAFMKQYKGALTPGRPDEGEEVDPDEENAFADKGDDSADEMLVGCAQDVLAAQHARDPEAYAEALKAFIQMC